MNRKVSELTQASKVNNDDIVMILQNGENKQTSVDKLRTTNSVTITLESTISANTNYVIPLSYQVR